ncbi:MAG: hypothetical protein JXA74_18445 [Anaerolineae bacterium]|nr:hypothetical protein [Anaerolineae bacterium]
MFERRGGPRWAFLGRTSDPERALRNLLERDALFTDRLRAEATRLGLTIIHVDATMVLDDLAKRVTEAFGLSTR